MRYSKISVAIIAALAAPALMGQAPAPAPAPIGPPPIPSGEGAYAIYAVKNQCLPGASEAKLCFQWKKWPTAEETMAAAPQGARTRKVDGIATMRCFLELSNKLSGCVYVAATPGDIGFGSAAVRLAPQFEVGPGLGGGSFAGATVVIPVYFELSGESGPAHDAQVRRRLELLGCNIDAVPTRAETQAMTCA